MEWNNGFFYPSKDSFTYFEAISPGMAKKTRAPGENTGHLESKLTFYTYDKDEAELF